MDQQRNKALALSDAERAELAHDLVASLDGKSDPATAEAWNAEIAQRVEEVDHGTATLVDADEVARRVRV